MGKKRAIIVWMAAMAMMGSLTACQKTEAVTDNNAGQAEGIMAETIDETEAFDTEQETVQQENGASLEILANSPEYQACAEWWDFCEGYDTDGAVLEKAGNELIEAGYEYEAYNCYSPEMEKKIDEICEKYGLSKLSGFQMVENYSELCSKAGVGAFCEDSENVKQSILCGWLYDGGTFFMEGNAVLADSSIYEAGYQFARAVKGFFISAYLNLGDLTGYSVREYTTKKGENVFLAGGADTNIYIIAEREKSFIVINVLGDLSDIAAVYDERLEQLADAFDFAAIP